jgi:NADH dehydrogenase
MIKPVMDKTSSAKSKILIVGAGFAGVRAARKLARHDGVEVTLISATDSFAYYPQLYHAATGGSRSESSLPLSDLLASLPVKVVVDTITTFDPDAKTVTGQSGTSYSYTKLILALGSVTNYFGIVGLKEFSYDIKTITGAERFKNHLHKQLVDDHVPDLNYVVVGGGPTGVELAAALGDYLRRITRLHGLKKPKYSIELVEAAPRLLPRSPESFGAHIHKQLESLGIKVMTGSVVQAETVDALQLKGESITSKTVVWTAGVANNPFFKENAAKFTLAKNGKVEVDEHLQASEHVYVIGDNAATQYSGMAQTAIDNGDFVVRDIDLVLSGGNRPAYKAKAPISVIPVGERWAAAQWGPVLLYGLAGYTLRRLADLVGYADIERWPSAIAVWLQDPRHEDGCQICAQATIEPTPEPAK